MIHWTYSIFQGILLLVETITSDYDYGYIMYIIINVIDYDCYYILSNRGYNHECISAKHECDTSSLFTQLQI